MRNSIKNGLGLTTWCEVGIGISEVRDPWQIGGTDELIEDGAKMMRLVFPDADAILKKIGGNTQQGNVNHVQFTEPLSEMESFYDIWDELRDYELKEFVFPAMPKCTNAEEAFMGEKIRKFECNMPALKNATHMFYLCTKLQEYKGDLSNLEDGSRMFLQCESLKSFTEPLPKLRNGLEMFYCCYSLRDFSSDLSSLKNGDGMFVGCPLSKKSVENIVKTIGTADKEDTAITIGYGKGELTPQEIKKYKAVLEKKNWDATFIEVQDA